MLNIISYNGAILYDVQSIEGYLNAQVEQTYLQLKLKEIPGKL